MAQVFPLLNPDSDSNAPQTTTESEHREIQQQLLLNNK